MFETQSILDKNFYEKFHKLYFNKKRGEIKYLAYLFLIALVCLGYFSYLTNGIYIWILFSCCYLLLGSYIYKKRIKKYTKNFIAINKEITNKETISYITSLSDDGIKYKNLDTESTGVLSYDKIASVYDIEGYYYLVTQSSRGLPINKNCLSENERKDVVEYLKGKLYNVKWYI